MIKSIIELLSGLKENGIKDIEKYLCIKHGPTIGDMYEGLTKELINKAIFDNLELEVCSGFIKNSKGDYSRQIDCMIVVGEGEKIPETSKKVYSIDKVIAVIEVKKDLFSDDLASAYNNLLSVKSLSEPTRDMKIDMLEMAYKQIVGNALPNPEQIIELSEELQYTYHALVLEAYLPLRIAFGYDGFKSEESLRKSFVNHIDNMKGKKGGGIVSFPNLIISGEFSLIKTNGMPFALATDSNAWISYGSYNGNPLTLLIELIWTRLYYMYDELSCEIFGEEDKVEGINPFLIARGNANGWIYNVLNAKLAKGDDIWKPNEVTDIEYGIVHLLCNGKDISVFDQGFNDYCEENNTTVNKICKNLNEARITTVENGNLKLLTTNCVCAIYNGKFYVGEDSNGQMTRWLGRVQKI